MSLRLKLFLPTLIGLLLFASFIHFFWRPQQNTEQFDNFRQTQFDFLKTIEPEIIRALFTSDFATLFEILDQQKEIHHRSWEAVTLTLANGTKIYPLEDLPQPTGKYIYQLSFPVKDEDEKLALITLSIDWESGYNSIVQHVTNLELVLLFIFSAIVLLGALWQNRMIITPLINLKNAVNKFQQGDFDHKLPDYSNDEIGELIHHFDLMRKEHQANEESRRISATAFDILEGIIITDSSGTILRVNQAFSDIFGYSENEITGNNPRVFKSSKHNSLFYQAMWSEINEQGQWKGEIWNQHKNGTLIPLYATVTAVKNDDGNTSHYVASYLDISESKQHQKELMIALDNAEIASRAKSDFLATMSHEIRTPMNGVLGMAQLLSDTTLTSQQKEYLNTIKLSGQNLLTIINDILDFSKIEAHKMELEEIPFNIKNTSFEVARLLTGKAKEKGLELLFNIAAECPHYVTGDPGRLRQILLNLIGNSIKFTEQGHILLDIRCTNVTKSNATIVFRVTDTGIGISQDKIEHLFNPFTQADSSTTRKFGGTGLGLSICHQLINLMGGDIFVNSEVGQGSEFTFEITLPLSESPTTLEQHSLQDKRILIVDDNATNLTILEEQLQSQGMKITCLNSSEKALELICSNENKPIFDAIILDYCMPGIDGAELGKQILALPEFANIPLILLTSAGQRGDIKRFQDIGFTGYLTKPVMDKTLLRALSAVTAENYNNQRILTSHSLVDAHTDEEQSFTSSHITNAKILLVEDDQVNRQVAQGILEKISIIPDVAINGIEAVDKAKEQYYDLILMDIQMPEMDGHEATRQIRKLESHQQTPIIALTANAQKSDRDLCLESGMDDFLSKPFEFEDLINMLNNWLPESADSEQIETEIQVVSQKPPGSNNGRSILNIEIYQKLKQTIPESFDDVIKTFFDDNTVKLTDIKKSIEENQFEPVTRIAHSLKSSSAAIGALSLSHTATLLETSSKQQDQETSRTLFTELEQVFDQTRQQVNTLETT